MAAIDFISFLILFCEEKNKMDCEFNTNFSQIKIIKETDNWNKTRNIPSSRELSIQYRCLLGIGSSIALQEEFDMCSEQTGLQLKRK